MGECTFFPFLVCVQMDSHLANDCTHTHLSHDDVVS